MTKIKLKIIEFTNGKILSIGPRQLRQVGNHRHVPYIRRHPQDSGVRRQEAPTLLPTLPVFSASLSTCQNPPFLPPLSRAFLS